MQWLKSEVGRIVNPVNRLIQTMTQKNTDKKGPTHYIHRRGFFGSFARSLIL